MTISMEKAHNYGEIPTKKEPIRMKSRTGSQISFKNLVKHPFPSFEVAINTCTYF